MSDSESWEDVTDDSGESGVSDSDEEYSESELLDTGHGGERRAEPPLIVRGAEPYRFEPEAEVGPADDAHAHLAENPAQHGNEERLLNTNWCSCGKCVMMTNVTSCKCCREVPQLMQKLEESGCSSVPCFTEHPWFEGTCLNPGTLQTAYFAYRQQYGARAVEGDRATKMRHVGYRQVVRWCWGLLGRHNRVPLPSCVMDAVRTAYPSIDGNYKGFAYPPLDEL